MELCRKPVRLRRCDTAFIAMIARSVSELKGFDLAPRPINQDGRGQSVLVPAEGQAHALALGRIDDLQHALSQLAPEPKGFRRVMVDVSARDVGRANRLAV